MKDRPVASRRQSVQTNSKRRKIEVSNLMNTRDNEHVELCELRGFVAEELDGALLEAEAIARGTRCKLCLLSLSLSPPAHADVKRSKWRKAVSAWKASPARLSFMRRKGGGTPMSFGRELMGPNDGHSAPFLQAPPDGSLQGAVPHHQWEMPQGLIDQSLRNPLNFTPR